MSYQETLRQLSYLAPAESFQHHLPNPDPERIARDIEENWEYCRIYHETEDWPALDRRALKDYAERLAEELKELYSEVFGGLNAER